jgi:transposase-like protein
MATADQMALRIMLDSKLTAAKRDRALAKLAKQVEMSMGMRCPYCGSQDTEPNRDGSTYACNGCHEQWEV